MISALSATIACTLFWRAGAAEMWVVCIIFWHHPYACRGPSERRRLRNKHTKPLYCARAPAVLVVPVTMPESPAR